MSAGDLRRWRVRRLGNPADALELEPVAPRPPGPGEVRVRIEAAGLNHPDLLLCQGRYQERPPLPFTPGFEAVGRVVERGHGVADDDPARAARLAPGRRVVVITELPEGGLSQTLTVEERQLYPVPDELPVEQAACLHIAAVTAHAALHRRARLRPGETVLVTGAAGGVGLAGVQLARAVGSPVIAVVTGAAKARACREAGATSVVDLAELGGDADLAAAVRALTEGRGADVVLDVVGGPGFDQLRRALAFEGRLVSVGFTGGIPTVPLNHLLLRNYSVLGLHLTRYRTEDPTLLQTVHDEVVAGALAGTLTPRVHRVVGIEDLLEGLSLLADRTVIGRVVVDLRG